MNEVEKMYKNANIRICKRKQGFTLKDCTDRDCKECGYYDMTPFTAEKQLELIKWLIVHSPDTCLEDEIIVCAFEDSLANIINTLWQFLTEEERKQIKEILE